MNFHVDRTHPASGHSMSPLCTTCQRTSALTGRTLPASGHSSRQHPVTRPRHVLTAANDRTRWSYRDQRPVTYSDLRSPGLSHRTRPLRSVKPCLFYTVRRWHRRTVRTLRADTPPVKFLTLAQMCQPPSVSPCAHVC